MRKVIRISLLTLGGVLLLAFVVSFISYHSFWPKDPQFGIDPRSLSFYHETYDECRSAFLKRVERMQTDFDSLQKGRFYVPSKIDDDLTVDWCYIPAHGAKKKLLIVSSGTHGIEGYTGSAIQSMFLDTFMSPGFPEDFGVLLVHALNPYGLKYRRKVSENNVDLNRNCVTGDDHFNFENKGYGELLDLLMPSGAVNLNSVHNQLFYLVAIAAGCWNTSPRSASATTP